MSFFFSSCLKRKSSAKNRALNRNCSPAVAKNKPVAKNNKGPYQKDVDIYLDIRNQNCNFPYK